MFGCGPGDSSRSAQAVVCYAMCTGFGYRPGDSSLVLRLLSVMLCVQGLVVRLLSVMLCVLGLVMDLEIHPFCSCDTC